VFVVLTPKVLDTDWRGSVPGPVVFWHGPQQREAIVLIQEHRRLVAAGASATASTYARNLGSTLGVRKRFGAVPQYGPLTLQTTAKSVTSDQLRFAYRGSGGARGAFLFLLVLWIQRSAWPSQPIT